MSLGINSKSISVVGDGALSIPLDRSVTAKTLLAAVNVPAGARGPKGRARVTFDDAMTAGANTKTALFELLGGVFFSRAEADPTIACQGEIAGLNNNSSPVSWRARSPGGFDAVASTTGATNTALAQDLIFYRQPGNSGETITRES